MKTLDQVKPVANDLNEASHTPGPWECSPLRGRWGYAVTKDGKRICDVQNVPNVNPENQSMNAALIASAPELLAAVESLLNCQNYARLRADGMAVVSYELQSILEHALTIAAKAKGEIYTPVF